jgi:hypothetical protein
MGGERWPSLAIQGIILTANLAFLLTGVNNLYIFLSVGILLSLFGIQTICPEFLVLHPKNAFMVEGTPSIDTYISRSAILIAIFCFCRGATNSLLLSTVIIFIVLLFPHIWEKFLYQKSRNKIANILVKKGDYTLRGICPRCNGLARVTRRVIMDGTEYLQTEVAKCEGECEGKEYSISRPLNIR